MSFLLLFEVNDGRVWVVVLKLIDFVCDYVFCVGNDVKELVSLRLSSVKKKEVEDEQRILFVDDDELRERVMYQFCF